MARLTLIVGALLIGIGLGGYLLGGSVDADGNAYRSWTALIPAFPGVIFVLCGLIALAGDAARKHAMHAAVAFALLGAIAPWGRLPKTLSADPVNYLAAFSLIAMFVLCLVVLVAGIRSFIQARRARKEQQQGFPVVQK